MKSAEADKKPRTPLIRTLLMDHSRAGRSYAKDTEIDIAEWELTPAELKWFEDNKIIAPAQ